ncbi:MAG: two-component system C4-dicarboxylate transport sensor histidine kinase DctB [Sulfurimonas sp.]|jgi:two-component system C4-dicarboxylate transport sensor histidine kinase DctB
MHKINKFGDNLVNVREDIKYVNENKTPVYGFTQGRTAHGFRNVFPIFSIEGRHLGAMEVPFSSETLQRYLTNINKIHTHFLVDKNILKTNIWKRDDTIIQYSASSEHKDFYISISKEHQNRRYFFEDELLLDSVRDAINKGFIKGEGFSLYMKTRAKKIEVVSFLPIKSLDKKKNLAWIVSYVENDLIYTVLQNTFTIRIIFFIMLNLLGYLLYKYIARHKEKVATIEEKAYMDGLTGVYNRNKFDVKIKKELERNERYKRNLSIALIDIDHFKIFNDTYGHLIGDEVLIMLAQTLKKKVRDVDTFARWGGEEFVILFPETSQESAKIICEKLRQDIESLEHPKAGSITASFV